MVIFIYITALSGNLKFIIYSSYPLIFLPLAAISYSRLPSLPPKIGALFLSQLYSNLGSPTLILLLVFLFSALFATIKMTQSFKGSLTK